MFQDQQMFKLTIVCATSIDEHVQLTALFAEHLHDVQPRVIHSFSMNTCMWYDGTVQQ
jgi:hypothetical protein